MKKVNPFVGSRKVGMQDSFNMNLIILMEYCILSLWLKRKN